MGHHYSLSHMSAINWEVLDRSGFKAPSGRISVAVPVVNLTMLNFCVALGSCYHATNEYGDFGQRLLNGLDCLISLGGLASIDSVLVVSEIHLRPTPPLSCDV